VLTPLDLRIHGELGALLGRLGLQQLRAHGLELDLSILLAEQDLSRFTGQLVNVGEPLLWSKRYPLIIQDAARIKDSAIFDAEVVWLDLDGVADFDAVHNHRAVSQPETSNDTKAPQ
jgi:hypothetical protein